MPSTRGNVYVKHGNGTGVYLYTAKYGHLLPAAVKAALLKVRSHWGDTPTVTRAIFSEIISKDVFGTNDAGISLTLDNNENFIVVVDDKNKLIGTFGEAGHCYSCYTFEQFFGLPSSYLTTQALSGGYRIERESPGVNRNRPDPYPMNY